MTTTATPPRERLRRGRGGGAGDAWRVIVLNDSHNTFEGVAFAHSPLEESAGGFGVVVGFEGDAHALKASAQAVGVGEGAVVNEAEIFAGSEGMCVGGGDGGLGGHAGVADGVGAGHLGDVISLDERVGSADILEHFDGLPGGEESDFRKGFGEPAGESAALAGGG